MTRLPIPSCTTIRLRPPPWTLPATLDEMAESSTAASVATSPRATTLADCLAILARPFSGAPSRTTITSTSSAVTAASAPSPCRTARAASSAG